MERKPTLELDVFQLFLPRMDGYTGAAGGSRAHTHTESPALSDSSELLKDYGSVAKIYHRAFWGC
jgi:hypothetical protein